MAPSKAEIIDIRTKYHSLLSETGLDKSDIYASDSQFLQVWVPTVLDYLKNDKPDDWTLTERAMWDIVKSYGHDSLCASKEEWKTLVEKSKELN